MVFLVTTFQFFSIQVVKFTTNMESKFEGIFSIPSQCATLVDGLDVALLGGY